MNPGRRIYAICSFRALGVNTSQETRPNTLLNKLYTEDYYKILLQMIKHDKAIDSA